jgi:hypothetical protein
VETVLEISWDFFLVSGIVGGQLCRYRAEAMQLRSKGDGERLKRGGRWQ